MPAKDVAKPDHCIWRHWIWKYQPQVAAFYTSKRVQVFVAGLIVSNFCVQCLWKQLDPDTVKYPAVWDFSENFFNVIFALELVLNMYGFLGRGFFHSAWNNFDFTVVSIGVIDMCQAPLPGPLKLVRMLRAFRVFRLFGRVESLKKIIVMIHRALPGVASAFALNFIVLCIYAVLAVDFFKDLHEECHLLEAQGRAIPPGAKTSRGKCFGEDYYGQFLRSLYTLFQILTGESWSEAAVRPVLHYFERSISETIGVVIFFVSFFMINAIVLLNVVVAVLIEGMSGPEDEAEEEIVEIREEDALQDQDDDLRQAGDGDPNMNGTFKACEADDATPALAGVPTDGAGIAAGSQADGSPTKTSVVVRKSRKDKWVELHQVNDTIAENVLQLQQEVGNVKSQLRDVSSEFKDSCSAILAELQERRESLSRRPPRSRKAFLRL